MTREHHAEPPRAGYKFMTVEEQLRQIAETHGVTIETIEKLVRDRPADGSLAPVIPLFAQQV